MLSRHTLELQPRVLCKPGNQLQLSSLWKDLKPCLIYKQEDKITAWSFGSLPPSGDVREWSSCSTLDWFHWLIPLMLSTPCTCCLGFKKNATKNKEIKVKLNIKSYSSVMLFFFFKKGFEISFFYYYGFILFSIELWKKSEILSLHLSLRGSNSTHFKKNLCTSLPLGFWFKCRKLLLLNI